MRRRWRWHVLSDLIRENAWTRGAELGLKDGRTMFYLLREHPDLTMVGVDLWQVMPERDEPGAETYADWPLRKLEANVRKSAAEFGSRAQVWKLDTVEAADRVSDASLDFVFVDADHSTSGVRRDLAAWEWKVKTGGMVLGHDIHWESVHAAVSERYAAWMTFDNNVWGVTVPPSYSSSSPAREAP